MRIGSFSSLCSFFSAAVLLLSACGKKPVHRVVTPAFFYWQTSFQLSPAELGYLDSMQCRRLYVKVLDLGRSPETGEIIPLARIDVVDSSAWAGRDIVPCVFITNSVFQQSQTLRTADLAEQVLAATGIQSPEIQFDCDWTPSTREAYFSFLREIKKRLPKSVRLSATIRLHQYKFPRQTGVPPVDRGMLMLYNTGDIERPDTRNSIFDPAEAEKYLNGAPADYPLPLDLALPVFQWALVYRQDELWKIIPGFDEGQLADSTFFLPVRSGQWRLEKGTFRSGFYLRPGDLLRMESVPPELLLRAAQFAARADLADDATVAFFHLDSAVVRRYPVDLLLHCSANLQVGADQKALW